MPQTAHLLAVCDDLLAATGHLRAAAEKAGRPLPPAEIKSLVNRLLDARLLLSPAKNKQHPTTNNNSK